jgi:hypothetical protein
VVLKKTSLFIKQFILDRKIAISYFRFVCIKCKLPVNMLYARPLVFFACFCKCLRFCSFILSTAFSNVRHLGHISQYYVASPYRNGTFLVIFLLHFYLLFLFNIRISFCPTLFYSYFLYLSTFVFLFTFSVKFLTCLILFPIFQWLSTYIFFLVFYCLFYILSLYWYFCLIYFCFPFFCFPIS